jgi:hypothetical protein
MAELERQRVKAKNDLEYAIAMAGAENGIGLAGSLYDESVRVQNAKAAEVKLAAAMAQADAELAFKQAQAEQAARAERANNILEWQYKYDKLNAESTGSPLVSAAGGSAGSDGSAGVSAAKVASAGSSGSSGSSGSAKASGSLFEDMTASGNPYTYLTTNHAKYGISSSASATMSRVYDEYKEWLSGSYEKAVSDNYSTEEYNNYYTILDKLAVNSASSGENPLNYVRRVESSMGKDFYISLMGNTLYNKFVGEVGSYYQSYSAMMSSGNPSKWLKENGSKYGSEVYSWLEGKI